MHDDGPGAYILAGGRSRRFGSDKARAEVNGVPLVVRQASALVSLGYAVTVVAREADQYGDLGLRTIPDLVPGLGPVGGLRTALVDCGSGWLLLSSCDLLELRAGWVESLLAARAAHEQAEAIVFRDDRWQPFPGLYHVRLLDRDEPWRGSSLQQVLNQADARPVPAPRIRQANRPSDLPTKGTGDASPFGDGCG